MKAILALLLGLIYGSWADDSVVLEFESPDSAEQSTEIGGGEVQSYGGIIIQVRQGIDASPTIALGSDIDDYDNVYCLNFIGLFEASDYDTTTITSGSYTEIDDTRIDLSDANCTTHQEAPTVFSIVCNKVGDATLTLTFTFIQDTEGDYGLEYIISLADYELSDDTAKLVMVQSVNECGDLIDLDSESEEEEEDTPEPTDTEEPEETASAETEPTDTEEPETTAVRRRLLQDASSTTAEPSAEETETTETEETEEGEEEESDDESTDAESLEEEDGISEDDSGEFDTGFARFVVNGQALDKCDESTTEIDSTLIYQPDDDELHIVFDSFNCTLVLDPFYGLDDSKYESRYGDNEGNPTPNTPSTTEDDAQSFGIIIASIIGLFACFYGN